MFATSDPEFLAWVFDKYDIDTEREEQLWYNYKLNVKRQKTQYWISPSGRVHKYTGDLGLSIISMHYMIASEIHPDLVDPEIQLEGDGWIKVGCTAYSTPMIRTQPTQKQIDTLFDLEMLDRLHIMEKGHLVKWNR